MNALKDIIQRCHKRRGALLRQRKTVVTPALYKRIPYHFKVHCARGTPVMLEALEQANISFMPIGHAPENDRVPRDFGGDRFLKRQGIKDWRYRRLDTSWGIQIYTGIPSGRDGGYWHDFDFKYEAISAAPEAVFNCIQALVESTRKPLLTLTKSGGLRFSCRVMDYLHPDTDAAKSYIYRHAPMPEAPHHREVYLEIRGEKGYSRWDGRYEILIGDLLDPPVIAKEVLFTPVDALRTALHEPHPPEETYLETPSAAPMPVPLSLGSNDLDLAKAAFLKRGFFYLGEVNDFHNWGIRREDEDSDAYVSLWEDQGVVWVCASVPNMELPPKAVPITDVWDDTGITPPIFTAGLPLSEEMLAVREAKLSPLAIKRRAPILDPRQHSTKAVYRTLEEVAAQIQCDFERNARVLSITAETVPGTDYGIESYVRSGGETCLNLANRKFIEAVEGRYQALNLPSYVRWRAKMYRWAQVKDIPVEVRMTTPFQHGNVCEDPERCRALQQKGGDPRESICPHCPVYTECQQRGYLSQPLAWQRAKAQIMPIYQLFFNPSRAKPLEHILGSIDEKERVYIIDEWAVEIAKLFIKCLLSKDVLEEWVLNWRGRTLANFAAALLNALEIQSGPNGNPIARVRAVMHAFQPHESELIRQMCCVNMRGKVVPRQTIDTETGRELAHYVVAFEGGASASIPVDTNAEDRLREKGLPYLPLPDFTPNEVIEIPMRMAEAIRLGILDTETVAKIQEFPTVDRDPNWTFWHRLKYFFTHYKRDTDAPMQWDDKTLQFWVPPVLPPSVKHLLLISPTLSEQHLRRVFPGEKIKSVRTEPIAWVSGNQVFQIRTGFYSLRETLNYDSNSDVASLSKVTECFLWGIRAEIERDPSVKHAIISNTAIIEKVTDLAEKENVRFALNFKDAAQMDTAFEDVQVVWMIGMPHWSQQAVWWRSQMLFGNDEEPLDYEGEVGSAHYKDKRIDTVCQQLVGRLLTRIIGLVGLNRWSGKKVVLLTSVRLPNVTDRPETLLFDWEDFHVAGGLDKLPDVIATRERFETESANLTPESSREEVERVLGCSARTANRVLQQLRGGNIPRVSFQEQILTLLADGEKRASQLSASIGSSPQSVGNELKRLVDIGEIVKVKRGVYRLPEV